MDSSLPDSSVHGILQARILEWVAISFSRGSSQPRNRTWVSCIAGRFFTNWSTRETWTKVGPILPLHTWTCWSELYIVCINPYMWGSVWGCVCVCMLSCVWLFCDPMDCSPPGSSVRGILQARLWSGLPFPPPGDLPDPGIEPASPTSPALAGRFFTTAPP